MRDGSFSHFLRREREKMGMRDGSFSHFSFYEKWEKEPSLIPIFHPSLKESGKRNRPSFPLFSHGRTGLRKNARYAMIIRQKQWYFSDSGGVSGHPERQAPALC